MPINARGTQYGQNPLLQFPQAQAGGDASAGPNIWPLRPKPAMPTPLATPGLPEGVDQLSRETPPNYKELPSGFVPGAQIPGHMSYGGPQLNTAAALSGLQNSMGVGTGEGPDPRLQRLRLGGQFGMPTGPTEVTRNDDGSTLMTNMGGNRADRAFAAAQQADVMKAFPPENAAAMGAIQAQHPAIQALAEQKAQQEAYGDQARAAGDIQAADIAAEQRTQHDIIQAQLEQRKQLQAMLPAILQGLTAAQRRPMEFPGRGNRPQQQSDLAYWNALLARLINQGAM